MSIATQQAQLDYGKRVKDLRHQVGLSQIELAKRAGLHNVTLSRLESGQVEVPRLDTLASIANAFGLPLEVMLGEKRVLIGIKIERKEEAQQ